MLSLEEPGEFLLVLGRENPQLQPAKYPTDSYHINSRHDVRILPNVDFVLINTPLPPSIDLSPSRETPRIIMLEIYM